MGAEIVAAAPPPLSLKCRWSSVGDNPSAKFSLIRALIRLITGKLMPIPWIFFHLSGGGIGGSCCCYWSRWHCWPSDQMWLWLSCNQRMFLAHWNIETQLASSRMAVQTPGPHPTRFIKTSKRKFKRMCPKVRLCVSNKSWFDFGSLL